MSNLRDREPFRKVQLTVARKLIAAAAAIRVSLEEQDQEDDDQDDDERANADIHVTSLRPS
jgi:hypothetical protein